MNISSKGLEKLLELRLEVDNIDLQIINLMKQRNDAVEKIGAEKNNIGVPVLQENRWEELLQKRIEIGKQLGISEKTIRAIWDILHEDSLSRQKQVQTK